MLAAQGIATGDLDVVVAGGMESMSNAPYLLAQRARRACAWAHGQVIDSMINDGLWCSFENWHMGNAGEVVATECGIGATAQDAYALESHRKAAAATAAGRFDAEILPVAIPQKKGDPIVFGHDESIRARHDARGARRACARVREGRHRDRRQCAAGQRRRRRARRDVERAGDASSA